VLLIAWGLLTGIYTFILLRQLGDGHHIFVVHGGVGDFSVDFHGWSLALLLLTIVLVPPAVVAGVAHGLRWMAKSPYVRSRV
jgi:hypothetical protein